MKYKTLKKLIMISLVGTLSISLFGCNQPQNDDAPTEEAPSDSPDDDGNNEDTPSDTDTAPAAEQTSPPNTQPVAGRSPVAITRINPTDTPSVPDAPDNAVSPSISGATAPEEDQKDPHEHKPLPNLFPVDKCQIEVNGFYNPTLAKELVTEINAARAEYMIDPVTLNTSLMACADVRCKEQYYFTGHFRPNGLPWYSVSWGNVQAELISIDYRTAPEIVEAWLSVNDTRVELMNPDFKQIGVSVYDIDGIYYVAAMFGYQAEDDAGSSTTTTTTTPTTTRN